MKSRANTAIFIFISLAVMIFILAASYSELDDKKQSESQGRTSIQESQFRVVNYYLRRGEKPVLQLNSDKLNIKDSENSSYEFIQPHGSMYSETSEIPVFFRADEGLYSEKREYVEFKDNIQMSYEGAEFEAKKLKYFANKNYFAAWGNIRSLITEAQSGDKLEIFSNEVQGWPNRKESLHKGNVRGKLLKKRKYQTGFDFSANVLRAKLEESLVTMSGSVGFKKQRFTAQAGRAELFMENFNKKLKYYVLYDDIRLEEDLKLKDGSTLVRKAYSETLEGYNAQGKIVLTGAPRVVQGDDVIKGYRITLRENVEVVEVDDANSIFTIRD